jgi:hypothetical protein
MRRNSLVIGALTLVVVASGAFADHLESRVLTWPTLKDRGQMLSGQILPIEAEGWRSLRISNAGSVPKPFPITALNHLRPTAKRFAVEGQIRHEGVEGDAYLEMWTVLPDGRRFFTRTLAETGPLQKINGTSGWRPFSLPFDLLTESPERVTLEINVFMPGAGAIDVGPLCIVNLSPDPRPWWSGQEAPWVCVLLAIAIALMGFTPLVLLWKNTSRRLIILLLLLVFAFGATCTIAGIVAVREAQPDYVFFPVLFVGVAMVALAPLACFMSRRHWREVEFRKMQALDT